MYVTTGTVSFTITIPRPVPRKVWDFSINMKDIYGNPVFWSLRPVICYYYCHNYISERNYVKKTVMIRRRNELVKKFNKELENGKR